MNFDVFLATQTARIKAIPVVTEAVSEQPFRWSDRASESPARRLRRHERYMKAKQAKSQEATHVA